MTATDGVLWHRLDRLAALDTAALTKIRDEWGISTLVGENGHMLGAGGVKLTGTPAPGDLVNRAHDVGLRVLVGAYWANYYNLATPAVPFHDTAAWQPYVDVAWRDIVRGAVGWGADGIALDDELWKLQGPTKPEPTWDYRYQGKPADIDEPQTRALGFGLGGYIGNGIQQESDGLLIAQYAASGHGFPTVADSPMAPSVEWNVWDGIFSSAWNGRLVVMDSRFYKSGTVESIKANREAQLAEITRTWRSAQKANGRASICPMGWPGRSTNTTEDHPLTERQIETMWAAFHAEGTRYWGLYSQSIPKDTAYFTPPMLAAFQAAAAPPVVTPPVEEPPPPPPDPTPTPEPNMLTDSDIPRIVAATLGELRSRLGPST